MIQSVVLGGSTSLQIHPLVASDPAWTSVESISGLGSPSTRNEVYDLARRHGQVNRTAYYSGRVVDIVGRVVKNNGTDADTAAALDEIKGKFALGQDVKLVFRRRQFSVDEFITGRVSSQMDVRYAPRDINVIYYGVQLTAGDPRMYVDSVTTGSYDPTLISATIGVAMPIVFPMVFGTPTVGSLEVTNGGNFPTPPVITITGPVVNPVVRNVTSSKNITLGVSLANGDTLIIDVDARTVTIAGGLRADVVDVPNTQWFELEQGSSSITLTGTAMVSGQTTLSVAWRDARI